MKCPRCQTENPGAAKCCMSCGTPLTAGAEGRRAVAVAAPPERDNRKALIAGGLAALALIAGLLWWFFRPNALAEHPSNGAAPSGLTEAPKGPIAPTNVADKPTTPEAPPPQEIIDYLKFLREVDAVRLRLIKVQTAQVLTMAMKIQTNPAAAMMSDNPDQANRQAQQEFQAAVQTWGGQWQQLGGMFRSYKAPIPPACAQLAAKYSRLLGASQDGILRVGNALSDVASGNPDKALAAVTGLEGSASAAVDESARDADGELQGVCDKFKIHKEFDIKAQEGGNNMYGIGH